MQFTSRKRRPPPAVILVSLIDIMLVLLIFLMVTTTFKKYPAVRVTLPESKQADPGASEENFLVTLSTNAPFFYLNSKPVTVEEVRSALAAAIRDNPELKLSIRADESATVGRYWKLFDVAKELNVRVVQVYTREELEQGGLP